MLARFALFQCFHLSHDVVMRGRVIGCGLGLLGLLAAPASLAQRAPAEPSDAPEPPPAAVQGDVVPQGPGRTLTWGTEPATPSDTGTKPTDVAERKDPPQLPWRLSLLRLDQSVSAQTVGVGKDYQTYNPSYDMTLLFRPRWYLYEDERQNVSLRGEAGLFREFTNSDVTTERGETSLTDAQLFATFARTLHRNARYRTEVSLRAPLLTFPTSKASARGGTILGVGANATIAQDVPLAGTNSPVFQSVTSALRVGYAHTFTKAIVPTNAELRRRRADPEGRLLIDDQFGTPAFPEHEGTIRLIFDVGVSQRVRWGTAFSWLPLWKYELPDTPICTVATGCVEPDSVEDPQRFVVTTVFESEVAWQLMDELVVAAGYSNLTSQVGTSGERRNMFYSPFARLYASVTANLDEIYLTATGRKPAVRDENDLTRRRVRAQRGSAGAL